MVFSIESLPDVVCLDGMNLSENSFVFVLRILFLEVEPFKLELDLFFDLKLSSAISLEDSLLLLVLFLSSSAEILLLVYFSVNRSPSVRVLEKLDRREVLN